MKAPNMSSAERPDVFVLVSLHVAAKQAGRCKCPACGGKWCGPCPVLVLARLRPQERVEKHGADEKILGRYARGRANRKGPSDKIVWHRRNGDGTSTRRELTINSPLHAFAKLVRACSGGLHDLTSREAALLSKWLEQMKIKRMTLTERRAPSITST